MADEEQRAGLRRGVVLSINLAQIRQVLMGDLLYDTGIWKLPVDRKVLARQMGIDGDAQGDLNSQL